MRIAQVAPLYESVPPRLYGGTERVVSYLTEELVSRGHEVTLFASGDSATAARLVPASLRSLRLDPHCVDPLARHYVLLEEVFRRANDFEVIHFHLDYLHFPLSRRTRVAQVSTLHGRLDLPDLVPLYHEFREMPVVSISDGQRRPLPWLSWVATVRHGIPPERLRFHEGPGEYLAFLGRVSPEKGLDQAIEIARRTGLLLRIAAKVDRADREYFEGVIEPLLDPGFTEFLGEIGEREKDAFLGGAAALLFPIVWPEPFGIVLIESLACGTPVVAFRQGSVPEILREGVDGFVVGGVEEAVAAVGRIGVLSRRRCRESFEERFTSGRMADDYLAVYARVTSGAEPAGAGFPAATETEGMLVPLAAPNDRALPGVLEEGSERPRVA